MTRPHRNAAAPPASGFSLLEVLIALAIFSTVLGLVFSAISESQKISSVGRNESEMQQNMEDVLALMGREIKTIGLNPPSSFDAAYLQNPSTPKNLVAQGLVEIGPRLLKFQGDINSNGKVDYVHYFLSGSAPPFTLNRFAGEIQADGSLPGGSPQKLSESVEDFSFKFYNRNGVETSLVADVSSIEVRLRLRSAERDPFTHQFRTLSRSTRIRPWNL
ncbi:MAG: prepilin-type N-terminal cleavage/methylation domain-containing protein [Acidobacteriota bacterium]